MDIFRMENFTELVEGLVNQVTHLLNNTFVNAMCSHNSSATFYYYYYL